MEKRMHRIHWQLTLYIGIAIFSLMLLFTILDNAQQKKQLINSRGGYMAQELKLLAAAIQSKENPQKRNQFIQDYCATMQYHSRPGHALGVLEPDGQFHSTKADLTRERVIKAANAERFQTVDEQGKQWTEASKAGNIMISMLPYSIRGTDKEGILYYSESLKDIEKLSRTLIVQRAAMLLLLFTAVVIIIWVFVKFKIAAPLNALLLRQYAAGKGDFTPQPFQDPHNEITGIHEMFDYMLKKLQEQRGNPPNQSLNKNGSSKNQAGLGDDTQ